MDKPRPGLIWTSNFTRKEEGKCHIHTFRYTGVFEMGGIPVSLATGLMEQDIEYIDSIAKGEVIERESLEDGFLHVAAAKPTGGPSWHRPCHPENCASGDGLWPNRVQAPPDGKDEFEDYVVIKYTWYGDVDRRRQEALRVAAERWRKVTCLNFVEGSNEDYDIIVGVYKKNSCTVHGLGYNPERKNWVNLGWCNSMRYVGNIIHELGHVIGLNHKQERPDAAKKYHGKGPYLKLHWKHISDAWRAQYLPDDADYTGSADNGEKDPHLGYAEYDFESIMHYPE